MNRRSQINRLQVTFSNTFPLGRSGGSFFWLTNHFRCFGAGSCGCWMLFWRLSFTGGASWCTESIWTVTPIDTEELVRVFWEKSETERLQRSKRRRYFIWKYLVVVREDTSAGDVRLTSNVSANHLASRPVHVKTFMCKIVKSINSKCSVSKISYIKNSLSKFAKSWMSGPKSQVLT
jgi:hypothetical protein